MLILSRHWISLTLPNKPLHHPLNSQTLHSCDICAMSSSCFLEFGLPSLWSDCFWVWGRRWLLANVDILQLRWHSFQQSTLLLAIFLIISLQYGAFILAAHDVSFNMRWICVYIHVHTYLKMCLHLKMFDGYKCFWVLCVFSGWMYVDLIPVIIATLTTREA